MIKAVNGANNNDVNEFSAKAAAIYISMFAPSAFFVLPMLLGAAADALQLNERQLGFLGAADLAGATVTAILTFFWVRRLGWRLIAMSAVLVLSVANFASIWMDHFLPLLATRFAAGLGTGAALSVALTALSDADYPERGFGYSVAGQVSVQVLGFLVLPSVNDAWGVDGIYLLLAASALSAIVVAKWLPTQGKMRAVEAVEFVLSPSAVLGLSACALFLMNIGCVWTYIERMAVAEGFSGGFIGMGLAAAVAVGIAGALCASWLRDRYGRLYPLAGAALGTVISVALLIEGMSAFIFLLATAIYNFVWNFAIPYQYAALSSIDPSGRLIALVPGVHGAGLFLGSLLAALFVTADSYLAVNVLAAASALLSLALFVPVCRRAQ